MSTAKRFSGSLGGVPLPTTLETASYTLAQQHPITTSWTSPERRRQLLAEEHQIDLDLATDHALADARRQRFGPHLPSDLFLSSWQTVRPGLEAMLSIRYELIELLDSELDHPWSDGPYAARAHTLVRDSEPGIRELLHLTTD